MTKTDTRDPLADALAQLADANAAHERWTGALAGLADRTEPGPASSLSEAAERAQAAATDDRFRLELQRSADEAARAVQEARAAVALARADQLEAEAAQVDTQLAAHRAQVDQAREALEQLSGLPWKPADPLRDPERRLNGSVSRPSTPSEKLAHQARTLRCEADGFRAAADGQPGRAWWPTVDDLPTLLDPVSGAVPQLAYLADAESAAASQAQQDAAAAALAAACQTLGIPTLELGLYPVGDDGEIFQSWSLSWPAKAAGQEFVDALAVVCRLASGDDARATARRLRLT